MLNTIIQQIELVATELSRAGLLGTGIACTFAGLIIWLAGLGMARLAAAAIGGFAGCFIAYKFFTTSFELLILAAFIGAIIGFLFELLLSNLIGYATYSYNLIMAVLSAVSGSILAMTGMAFLLYFKGSQPLRYVRDNQKLFLIVLLAMIVFGTLEQLVFCKKKMTPAVRKTTAPPIEIKPTRKSSWRNK